MIFRYRPARPQDLMHCVPQARDAFAYRPSDQDDIRAMWVDLLTTGSTVSMVIEECGTGAIAFFVVMVFVDEAFAARLAEPATSDLPPLTSGYWLEAWRAGTLPVLTREQVRTANATTGVTLFCVASGVALDLIAEGLYPLLLSKINGCHPFTFAGFRMNAIYVELYDEITRAWGDTFGYNRLTDFSAWYQRNGGVPASYSDQKKHPCLYGITRAEAVRKFGSMVTTFFHYEPPLFGFSQGEQEMLLWALEGETDMYLSGVLCVAPVTVRKRWDAIYERVTAAQPGFFGAVLQDNGKRGAEKKRRLLSYLQHHMEELRPYEHLMPPQPAAV